MAPAVHRFGAVLLFAALAATGCAAPPPAPTAGHSTLAGRVELVPPDGVAQTSRGGYGDRRMRGVERVDYSRPGFAVVYVDLGEAAEAAPDQTGAVQLAIADGAVRTRFEPAEAALRADQPLWIHNAGGDTHLVSVPGLGVLRSLAPGERVALTVDRPGDYTVHLLDRPGTDARVFATPGPFARVASDGRYAIVDLPAGRHHVHLWHARLPPSSRTVELTPNAVVELDWALGVTPREPVER